MSASRHGYRVLHGLEVPFFLYGTAWKEERTEALTRLALDAGFVGIDTANQRKHYFEAAVGAALTAAKRARAELFLQTKFTFQAGQDQRLPYDPSAPLEQQLAQSFESSLVHLGTDFIDSYLLHGPSSRSRITHDDWEVWRAMERLHGSGRVKYLGVSNVSPSQLRTLFEGAAVKPAFVQNRCYAQDGWDREVRAFCRDSGVVYQAFSLLTANRRELERPAVRRIADRTGRSVAEIVFRFAFELGMVPLTGTSSEEHMRLDLGALELVLEPSEIVALERLAG
jgi:diketogulonate reductase-like aldo/keto reductase